MELNDGRLETSIDENNWDSLLSVLKPKLFARDENGKLVSPRLIAKIADALINKSVASPPGVKIILLKCLMNSCVNGYISKTYKTQESALITDGDDFYATLYRNYVNVPEGESMDKHNYPFLTHFPYDGVVKWAANFVSGISNDVESLSDDELVLLRLSLQFLCNLCQFSISFVRNERFKKITMMLVCNKQISVSRAVCAFIHNALTSFEEDFYSDAEKNQLTTHLIGPVKIGIPSAIDTLKRLLKEPGRLCNVYDKASSEDRLYLLEIFLEELREPSWSCDTENTDVASFLADRFKRRSDLVLKTVNSYMDGTEPMEITILLDILGVLTSTTSADKHYANNLQEDKSLLINCICEYGLLNECVKNLGSIIIQGLTKFEITVLLKSLHMVGRESDNFFTPVQKLSELAPNEQILGSRDSSDIQSHPAFGFKAGLIRVIGNMVHKHEVNQDLVRETDGIPLLLDCCNMDARNPLIMQWTILAMRNLCENNKANQDIVKGLNKVGVADSYVLHEMGMVLHDQGDGKAVGIAPLKRS